MIRNLYVRGNGSVVSSRHHSCLLNSSNEKLLKIENQHTNCDINHYDEYPEE